MGPTEEFELEARRCGYRRIAGVDEAGRGPLAGPVVAAAVILPVRCRIPGLDDSKQLSPDRRAALYPAILARAISVGIGTATAQEIDQLNILEATRLAMARALAALDPPADFVLTDAVTLPHAACPVRPVIKGDALSLSVAAASVLAKVTRDHMMEAAHRDYPEYNFAGHKGYGTEEHLDSLARYGPCPIHRKTFAPVAEALGRITLDREPVLPGGMSL